MSLPISWVERIFAKLAVTYGEAFTRFYNGQDPEAVKANWAEELANFQPSPDAIKYGLEHLPSTDRPPTALQFRDLCRSAPASCFPSQAAALPAPAPGPADPAVIAKVKGAAKRSGQGDKEWAHRLRERERNGQGLSLFQRQCWRQALRVDPSEAA